MIGGSGSIRCRLVYKVTVLGKDVKGGRAVHLPLTAGSGAVTPTSDQQRTRISARELRSSPDGGQSIYW